MNNLEIVLEKFLDKYKNEDYFMNKFNDFDINNLVVRSEVKK